MNPDLNPNPNPISTTIPKFIGYNNLVGLQRSDEVPFQCFIPISVFYPHFSFRFQFSFPDPF